jgi:L-aspartate oxidase
MTRLHPDAELAPRDVVARGVSAITASGGRVLLDASGIRNLAERFPGTLELAGSLGLDATRQPLPVVAAAHFHMGGIATDLRGATSLPGLWACGEVASTGLHGGNRLASNSLLEGLVFGQRIAAAIRASHLPPAMGALEVPRASRPWDGDESRVAEIRRVVGESLGTSRCAVSMISALRRLGTWEPTSQVESNLVVVAIQVLQAALGRRGSRGSHQRSDFAEASAEAPARHFSRPVPVPVTALGCFRSQVA